MDMQALVLSLKLAFSVCAILMVVGMPISYWLSVSRWRWKFLVESVVAMPLVLPPTVLGFYVLVALGPRSPLGRAYAALFGHGLAFTFAGLVFASVLYSLPFAVQPMAQAFEAVDNRLVNASAVLGASRVRTFFRIILPLARNGVIVGAVLSFAHTLGEFGVVLMVGGDIPGATRTISIAIYDDVQALNYAAANTTALALLLVSFLALAVVSAVNRQVWRRPWRVASLQ